MADATPAGAAALCANEFPRLVGALALYLGDRSTAEDLAQETLLRVCRNWERVGRLESPGGWAWRVALNLARSHSRRQRIVRRVHLRLGGDTNHVHRDTDVADAIAVREAVAALPERQRRALVLRYYVDWPARDVAAHMGLSADAVRSLTKRAVAALRAELADGGPAIPARRTKNHG